METMVNITRDSERKLIGENVITKDDLVEHFRTLGLQKGMVVYVQSALEYFSYVVGGNRSIIEALQEVLGYEGTFMTSSFTLDNVDPLNRDSRACKPYQVEVLRESIPAFNKKLSQSRNQLANQMMMHDGVYRSNHPTHSFVAWGKYAKLLCDKQLLHFPLQSNSPIQRMAELNGYVLLLGMKYEGADIFKAARINDENTPIRIVSSPLDRKGKKGFMQMLDYAYEPINIRDIEDILEERQIVNETLISRARCRFFSAKEALSLSKAYFYSK
ncbi:MULTISPECIES: AAC(3) family N-acetyltransferase [Breznakia]|uniref:Aminoglycoside N(3)-acetyltransferase n=1 Tax=Breznakia blatticola TaxID=1754012 RepID=A0A4R8A469_9FIRM|nr:MULTISPECIES: AAC(3) family N-acetyltransferase [Breznakia]MDH6367666.1 aminoglycoside 3-N-acetyltransferase [Breznakia sp. PH1-1]MDH6404741.1 aminoglycoside 3-N-acetyltransferase [Breznakia sp. PF1-11]MDH6412456.1 aminoglycoside 3-N-acetyltransferase [Breznakia sp. PFB1-11]MDH6414816.1 aminoglycoside 3-N-acetyltransferase [Breznakia sp. PFB1-14]MDH6417140.1 aminoglycoside 3-N-acetyltransferase [Breznakia sp. PFB1-4]